MIYLEKEIRKFEDQEMKEKKLNMQMQRMKQIEEEKAIIKSASKQSRNVLVK